MNRPAVLLDCDPGHDDVVALLLASQHTDLRGVTTVAGNAPLSATTRNALGSLQIFGVDVPVHSGADRPLVAPPRHAPEIHGDSGLAGTTLPDKIGDAQPEPAVERILEESRATPGLWIVATGPLTNVATALRADPGLAGRIAGISVMGGGMDFGNVTPAAEFNFWADPHAAQIVVSADTRVLICGLDVTHQVLADDAFAAHVRTMDTPVAHFLSDVVTAFVAAHGPLIDGEPVGPVHDACAVLALTHPELFTFRDFHVAVDTGDSVAAGTLIVDRRGTANQADVNAAVAVDVDGEAVMRLIEDAIRAG